MPGKILRIGTGMFFTGKKATKERIDVYKIAIATSDGKNVDLKFGQTGAFYVYEIDGKSIKLLGIREVKGVPASGNEAEGGSAASCGERSSCGSGSSCGTGSGCGGNGQGCGGGTEVLGKVSLIEDCRAVVALKVGFQAQKQFEKKAISVFDVDCSVEEALEKISSYYYKIDNRQSLRQVRASEEE